MKEKCGLYGGIFPRIALEIRRGLMALQHRGQESAGLSIATDNTIVTVKNSGLVREALPISKIENIEGNLGIGHVRYSTFGGNNPINAQPIELNYMNSKISIAHNGNIENSQELRDEIEKKGHILLTNSDTEIFLHKLVEYFKSPPATWDPFEMAKIIFEVEGAYSLLFLFEDKIVAIRDPKGYRPLWVRKNDGRILFSSEDSAFPEGGERFEMEPGSVAIATKDSFEYKRVVEKRPCQCVFEYIYFARSDSNIFGKNVYEIRERMGRKCAIENPVNADAIIPVMDSGLPAAIGFSTQSGIPIEPLLVRNPWIGRTFIKPSGRFEAVEEKLSIVKEVIEGKKIVIVDDSLVRGTTISKIVEIIRKAKPLEIHFRIASPPVKYECFWGIDIPSRDQLFATKEIEEAIKTLGIDSLSYLSIEGMCEVLGGCDKFCLYCFTGRRVQ